MRRNSNILIVRMVTVALLSALGIVMMLFVKFPYPFAPWIEIEFSDITILIGYALTNFVGALAIAIIKTLISLFVQPVGIYYIGQLAAFLSSFTYLFCLFLSIRFRPKSTFIGRTLRDRAAGPTPLGICCYLLFSFVFF